MTSTLHDRTGREIGRSRNLRGILDWARPLGRSIRQVEIKIPSCGGTLSKTLLYVAFMDGTFAVADFASWCVARDWVLSRRSWGLRVECSVPWSHTRDYPASIYFA